MLPNNLDHHNIVSDFRSDSPPPVPAKDKSLSTPSRIPVPKIRQRRPPPLTEIPQVSKPLPPPPACEVPYKPGTENSVTKPLPALPWKLNANSTLLWTAGLGICFVAVVLLLPVFLEGDAMPGMNRLLRAWGKTILGRA
ncbi:hypothetical protein BU23DRAFT_215899 [Bimuria novae-zelandiae CBS 107.79]|uniref:Uncharacterized protein n=1 Tax=Bimuria novae-zelandiae CBS 107.79 TaxID=1447943 RepID=A0A6A5V286_9PLEO|nr:hypothetical protein BU23DRAFT_215899 [Bimuria novae-zelandiae CBS 107.79]